MTNALRFEHHPASGRGVANHGWLNSRHSFSFGGYYNPQRMQFGALRVLNDDIVGAGAGFGSHPHADMEIISIPTHGSLLHRDSMGNEAIINAGEIQVMSAGTGIEHSEMNASRTHEVRFFQIWIQPNKQGVAPRYEQKQINAAALQNNLLQVVSPTPSECGVWIHQDATIYLTRLSAGSTVTYDLKDSGRGLYVFSIEGGAGVNDQRIGQRDALAITGTGRITLRANEHESYLMLLNVPMGAK